MRALIQTFLLSTMLAFAGFGVSCQSASEKIAEKVVEQAIEGQTGTDVDIHSKDGEMTIETAEGSVKISTKDAVWPKDMPAGVDPLAGAEIVSVNVSESPVGKAWSVTYTGADIKAVEAYETKLKGQGYQTSKFVMGEGATIGGEKDGLVVSVMFSEGTAVLTVAESKQ
jgi:hypothetical protein